MIIRKLLLITSLFAFAFKNSITFNDTKPNFKLLTGPNMAGKSTFMRELAHIIIMFQI